MVVKLVEAIKEVIDTNSCKRNLNISSETYITISYNNFSIRLKNTDAISHHMNTLKEAFKGAPA